jgi:hypothetical protein
MAAKKAMERQGRGGIVPWQGALRGAGHAAWRAYGKIPEFSFMDRATFATLLFCVAAYVAFTAYVFFSTPSQELRISVREGELGGISPLALAPGESYAYEVSYRGEKRLVGYAVLSSPGCGGLVVVEEAQGAPAEPLCVPKEPSEYAAMESKLAFGNRSILLFAPWMLAAREGFSWRLKSSSSAAGFTIETPMRFETAGVESTAGRQAYDVIFTTEGEGDAMMRYYVDAEKKVMLSLEAGNFTARLVSAPFMLNWTN